MSLLKSVTRNILHLIPILSIPKECCCVNKEDYLAKNSIKFRMNNRYLEVENEEHQERMIKDISIIKEYLSTDIIKEYEYLPFIKLGIEYLKQHAEFEDAQKGHVILMTKIKEIQNNINEKQRFMVSL